MASQHKPSGISWTDETWNPVRGCSKVSAGCKNCYAETFSERWRGIPGHPFEQGFDVRLVPEKLEEPMKWKKPRRIFVNSMSDLFHEKVPFQYIDEVFFSMSRAAQHTFQILTKRPRRMLQYLTETKMGPMPWPLQNVWLGVSVEDQRAADERIPILLKVPAAVRFLSCEPLLGPVDLGLYLGPTPEDEDGAPYPGPLHWVIVGGESGRGARKMETIWAQAIRNECENSGAAFFMKQMGGVFDKGGALESIPEDLRIRQFPESVVPA